MIVAGADIIHKSVAAKFVRSFVVKGASEWTSAASIFFRSVTPSSLPRLSFLPKAVSLGGQLGRTVPGVGWVLTTWDAPAIGKSIGELQKSIFNYSSPFDRKNDYYK